MIQQKFVSFVSLTIYQSHAELLVDTSLIYYLVYLLFLSFRNGEKWLVWTEEEEVCEVL